MERGLISVDRWSEGSQAYFLTHLHADHTNGLSSSWNKGPIFCSPITAKLFPVKFPDFNISLLRVLEIGSSHSLSLVSTATGFETVVEVMAIDAHHCPGAVMYLFRGKFGCMLYTGDFRWEAASERAQLGKIMLLRALRGDKVDVLYLDNTYCNPSYAFPPRDVVAQQVVDIISSHPDHDIIIGIDTLGKEDLLLYISHVLKVKIWVWPERLQVMHLLGFDNIFTTKTSLTRVRAVPRYSFGINTLEALNKVRPTIGIMPSGLPWMVSPCGDKDDSLQFCLSISHHRRRKQQLNKGSSLVQRIHHYIYSVPYSDHSCFSEIQEFVELFQPSNIRGIVSSSFCYIDPLYYFGHIHGSKQTSGRSCNKIQRTQLDESVTVNSTLGNTDCNQVMAKKERTMKVGHLGLRTSRVSVIRRTQRGSKIMEIDSID